MISNSVIQNLSIRLQSTELNIRREYIQHLFLSYFYRHPESSKIYFKGGTALKIIYNSPRFSEDLDFNSITTTINKIEDIIVQTTREIEREGIKIDIKESKKTSGGYLAIINFFLHGHEINIQLEISQRNEKNIGEIVTVVNDFIPSYTLMALKQEQLISGKIHALLDRQKARDFYDLYYILRANLLSADRKNILPKILVILNNQNIQFEKELKIFLPKNHWSIIKNFKNILEQEIRRAM